MNKKNKEWEKDIKGRKSVVTKQNEQSTTLTNTKEPTNPTRRYSYVQKTYRKNKNNIPTVLTQFICLECHNVNMAEELVTKETKLYSDKNIPCSCCKKVTTQICVKDKEIKKAQIEMTAVKTPEEERAYRIMTVKKGKRSITQELPQETPKEGNPYQKRNRRENRNTRGKK